MGYQCKIIADSISPQGHRITSLLVTYPRIIHAEFLRHRMLSRNSASSRAIPFEKMVKMVEEDPFIPTAWQKDHKGMQGSEYITNHLHIEECVKDWLEARDSAIKYAARLNKGFPVFEDGQVVGSNDEVTKQLCNRLLETFLWHTELITATAWDNFFNLRCPMYTMEANLGSGDRQYSFKSKKDLLNWVNTYIGIEQIKPQTLSHWYSINKSQAEIHIQAIAEMIWDYMNEGTPVQLKEGEWHAPFIDEINDGALAEVYSPGQCLIYRSDIRIEELRIRVATARAARLSYLTHEGEINYQKDLELHNKLLASKHFSCFEHCARAMTSYEYETYVKGRLMLDEDGCIETTSPNIFGWCNNFQGWIPYRYLIENE